MCFCITAKLAADVREGSKPEKLNESRCLPLFTQQRTSPRYFGMSVSCQQPTSFDQFSCLYEELVRYRDAKGFCGLEIDHQIELGRLLDRQIGRLGAFENFIDVVACTAEQIGYIGAVDDQSTYGELSEKIDR